MKKLLKALIATFISLTAVVPVLAVDDQVLLEDGVEVTMSSSEMDPAANSLSTGETGTARSWEGILDVTSKNKNTVQESIDLVTNTNENITIEINDELEYQDFEGIGSSIDASTVYSLSKMSSEKQKEIIKLLIDPVNGLGLTRFRLSIGSSDFQPASEEYYTYYDVRDTENYLNKPETLDWYNETGNGFSIQKDIDLGIIKTINLVQETAKELGIEDDISFYSCSWSLPGWMKVPVEMVNPDAMKVMCSSYTENESISHGYGIINGYFKYGEVGGVDYGEEYIEYAATYFVRYLEEYAKQGITIDLLSLQNEMKYGESSWIAGGNITEEAFVKIAKRVKELANESNVLNDEQKSFEIYGLEINELGNSYTDSQVKEFVDLQQGAVDGIGIHDYDSMSASKMADGYKTLYNTLNGSAKIAVTERSLWGTYGMNRVAQYFRSGCVSYNAWVTMLDSNGESSKFGGNVSFKVYLPDYNSYYDYDYGYMKPDPTLLIQDASNNNNYVVSPEAYMMGQFAKYIRPGYVRVDSTDSVGTEDFGISNVVFKDPDTGKLVMVVVNNSNEDQTFTAACNNYQFSATVPACNVATYQWNPNDIDVSAPNISGNDATIYVGDTTDLKTILNLKVTDDKDGEISEYTINDNGYNCQKAGKYVIEV
ncbi:glycoside hydrolase family 30 beta sandwich domain-containing protein, partial [Thomasclavelia sp.]|uniref:glycoside hydrolase family 30 beta sandwich domain-containing protein n=1 Tax=Thomasclavelia sp. TaxID=3025757 RepID=UPI0025F327B1